MVDDMDIMALVGTRFRFADCGNYGAGCIFALVGLSGVRHRIGTVPYSGFFSYRTGDILCVIGLHFIGRLVEIPARQRSS